MFSGDTGFCWLSVSCWLCMRMEHLLGTVCNIKVGEWEF